MIHSDCYEKVVDIKQALLTGNPKLAITIDDIYPVISAHTGLDCIAIQFIAQKDRYPGGYLFIL